MAEDYSIRKWDLKTYTEIKEQQEKTPIKITCGTISADGTKLLSSTDKGIMIIHSNACREIETHSVTYKGYAIGFPDVRTCATTFSHNDQIIARGSSDGSIYIINTETGRSICALNDTLGYITSLAFSPDGKLLAASTRNNGIYCATKTSSPSQSCL